MKHRRKEAVAAAVLAAAFIGWLLLREDGPSAIDPSSTPGGSGAITAGTSGSGGDRPGLRPSPSAAASATPTPGPGARPRSGASRTTTANPARRPTPSPTSTRAPPSGTVEGRVERHADKTPVEGATVQLGGHGDLDEIDRTATTDARGRFRFDRLPVGRYRLIPSAKEQEGRNLTVRIPRRGAVAKAVLRIGGRTTLRFVPPPRKGDRVRLKLREGNGEQETLLEDGDHLSDLYVGRWDVAYRARDGRFAADTIDLHPGENTMRLDLQGPGRVEVDARDAAGKRIEVEVKFLPLKQPTAVLGARSYAWIERTTYTIRRSRELAIPPGRYLVVGAAAVAEGYAPAHREVEVEADRKRTVRLRLERAATVEVAVPPGFFHGDLLLAGPRGWYFVDPPHRGDVLRIGVPETGRGVLIVWDRARDRAGHVELAPSARPTLVLEPVGGVRIQVLRPDGGPEGAGVEVKSILNVPSVILHSRILTHGPPSDRPGAVASEAFTDARGRVTEKLPPGRWTISAQGVSAEVTVPTRTVVDATLRLKD